MNMEAVPVVVLDANVLYGATLRNLILYLADVSLFQPKWSALIQEEWLRNLLKNRSDLSPKHLARTQRQMDNAFPNANTVGFETLIPQLNLPDPDDHHVLALAIHTGAKFILTSNRKDFPKRVLDPLGIDVLTPNQFLKFLQEQSPETVQYAFEETHRSMIRPAITKKRLVEMLVKAGLTVAPEIFEV